jgi:hypothetical protein
LNPEPESINAVTTEFPESMIESSQPLHAAWAAAWLREYRCHTRYLSLLAQDMVEDFELRFAWLDWWNATCVCREALRRLERFHVEL